MFLKKFGLGILVLSFVLIGAKSAFAVAPSTVDELATLFSLPTDVTTDGITLSHDSSGLTITLPERSIANYLPSAEHPADYYILTLSDYADPFNYSNATGTGAPVGGLTGRGYLKLVLTNSTNITTLNIHEAVMGEGGVTGNGDISITAKGEGETILNVQVLSRTATDDTAADATALNKWSPVADGTAYVVFTLADTTPVIVPIKVVMATTIPAAPTLTANDTTNTVVGTMTTAMEYDLDSAGYVTYVANTFNALDLSGEHTLAVRVKAVTGLASAGSVTTLTFTTNPVRHGSSGGSSNHTTIPPVTPPTTELAPGCSAGNLFNTSTGKACVNNAVVAQGCSAGNVFNTSTGKPCSNNTEVTSKKVYALGQTTLKNGSKGEAVKELQRFLNDKLALGLVVDGMLGPKTIAVIKTWQKDNGLDSDGLIGPKTKAMMNK